MVDNKPPVFASEDLVAALLLMSDLLERAPLEYVLLKDTAKQALIQHHESLPKLDVRCLEIGITKRHFTEDGSRMLKTLLDLNKIEYNWAPPMIRCMVKGVPVHIQVLQRNYGFMRNPTKIFFAVTEMYVPNPFDKYYKAKYIVR